jgi:hypothetical protein
MMLRLATSGSQVPGMARVSWVVPARADDFTGKVVGVIARRRSGRTAGRSRRPEGRRFAVHAAMTGLDRSELFAELVKAGCRRSVVSHHQVMAEEPAEPDAGQSRGARL